MRIKKLAGDCDAAPTNTLFRAEARGTHAAMARSVGTEDPIEGDELSATISYLRARGSGVQASPIFDEAKMSQFVAMMGPEWVAKALRQFAIDVERGLASLDAATTPELAGITHGMVMMAAHGGFTELLNVSEVAQREARQGFGLNRVAELRAAGERALAAMRSYTPHP